MRPSRSALSTAAIVAVVLALLPFVLSSYHQALAAQVGIYFIAILGLNILVGYSGQISIGHGAFMAIGGYTTAILSRDHDMNLVLTMVVAFAVCFASGLLLGLPALRLSGVYLALATFALAVSTPQIVLKFDRFLGGSNGVQSHKTVSHTWLYGASWTTAAVMFVLAWLFLRGRTGRAFRAIRDSEVAAISSGVELPVYKTLAFAVRDGDERLRSAQRVRRPPLARAPRRRGGRGSGLALGAPGGGRVRRAAADDLEGRSGRGLGSRPGRRVRARRRARDAAAPAGVRGLHRARRAPARPGVSPGWSLNRRSTFSINSDPRAS
jgi:hypothetical protein